VLREATMPRSQPNRRWFASVLLIASSRPRFAIEPWFLRTERADEAADAAMGCEISASRVLRLYAVKSSETRSRKRRASKPPSISVATSGLSSGLPTALARSPGVSVPAVPPPELTTFTAVAPNV
jgi:hypothetical protein